MSRKLVRDQCIDGLSRPQAVGEEGVETVPSRKQRAAPAVPQIFDGEKEAKLIALACSRPPKDLALQNGLNSLKRWPRSWTWSGGRGMDRGRALGEEQL